MIHLYHFRFGVGLLMSIVVMGCATPLTQKVDHPLITYDKAIAAGMNHVRQGLCNNAYENISTDDLRLTNVEYVRTDRADVIVVTYDLPARATYRERGGDVPIIRVYMTGSGKFLHCVEGHRVF